MSERADATADFVARFDVVVLDAPAGNFPALAAVPVAQRLAAAALGDPTAADYALAAKPKLLAAAGPARVAA